MNTEPKLGTCDKTPNHLISVGCPYLDSPHTHNKFCIHWREGESAAVQLCGEYVTHVIAGASWINCALPKGHKMKGHRGKGTCVKHGEYFGEVGAFPQCPQWPDCIVKDIPPAAETAITAEQLYNSLPEETKYKWAGEVKPHWAFQFADLCMAHVREAAQREQDLYALLRGICEEVIDWLGTLSYDCIDDSKSVLDHPLSKDIRIKLQQMYDHPLDNKLLIRTDQIEAKLERAETVERKLKESRRDLESVSEQRNTAVDKKRAAERKLAEVEKALQSALFPLAVLVQSGECVAAATALNEELKLQIIAAHDEVYASLASLRVESKEG